MKLSNRFNKIKSSKILLSFGLLLVVSAIKAEPVLNQPAEMCSNVEYASRLAENKEAYIFGQIKSFKQLEPGKYEDADSQAKLYAELSEGFDHWVLNMKDGFASDAHRSAHNAYVFMGYAVKTTGIIAAISLIVGTSYLVYKKYIKKSEPKPEDDTTESKDC